MRFINGYEDKYSVTKDGKIFSHITKRFLKQDLRGKYYAVKLGKYGKKISVHRIVAMAYIENPDNKPFINHKDGNKLNNSLDNLEWCSAKENTFHAQFTGLMKVRTYPVFRRQKISNSEIANVHSLRNEGLSVIKIAKKYNVTRGAIYAILNKIKQKEKNVI